MQRSCKGQVFTEIVLEVFKLGGLLVSEGDALTKVLGLTSARWKVLGALAYSDTPMSVSQIAHSMGQTRQSVQRLADVMERDGIVVYRDNPHHKKAKLVILSDEGRKVFERLEQKQIPWANEKSASLTVKDLDTALSVLRKMTKTFET